MNVTVTLKNMNVKLLKMNVETSEHNADEMHEMNEIISR